MNTLRVLCANSANEFFFSDSTFCNTRGNGVHSTAPKKIAKDDVLGRGLQNLSDEPYERKPQIKVFIILLESLSLPLSHLL